ncbi:glycine/D-amino acid oxidase-like deaminating enzyme [Saccharothrix ecbatanensis]|uniref:Glycine/D-amino acid oxidase-like deaminating enzyme n=1 Tax=Saccharothrix ecbatanensis TaxID=1105145 RepID=A0A7W9HIU8_9PSEU|nr:FAD-binding oxidoreductase [Saccharothrix ecbatanensis]MBB5802995.1 glycine/D-amino acid oxidase-like deaminating enzyme [Saccharothrix ecbatanensis]
MNHVPHSDTGHGAVATDRRGGGQPVPVKHTIYWRETETVEPGPPLDGDVRCDVVVVGGGYTGMWTAYQLKQAEPSMDIHVVEADYAGSGASGHGDGFVTPTIGHNLAAFVNAFGIDRAKVAYSLVGRSILELDRFCRQHGIDAQLEPNGYFQVATNASQMRWLERDIAMIEQMGARAPKLLDRAAMARRIGSPEIIGGMEISGALVNPHRLVRGLSRAVRAAGIHVHERTPATEVIRGVGGGHVVRTPGGTVTADKMLLATNAHQHQFPEFRREVKPLWSYAAVSEPLTDRQLAQVDWAGREGFVEALNFIVFARLTAGNRLLVGGGPAPYHYGRDMDDRHMRNLSAATVLRQTLARYFPVWKDVRFTHVYGGCLDMTRDFVPHVGTLGDGVFFAHGYCGNGVALTHTIGKALRDLMLDRETAYSTMPFIGGPRKTYPAEPLAYLGVRAQNLVLSLQDRFPGLLAGR